MKVKKIFTFLAFRVIQQLINFFFSPTRLLKSILNNDYEISQNVDVIYAGFSEYEKRFKKTN